MKKLLMAILLSIGLAFGGSCAITGSNVESTIPDMEYDEMDLFENGNISKIPAYIDAITPKWFSSFDNITPIIIVANFVSQENMNEKITIVGNNKEKKLLLLVYTKDEKMDFYIYDGRQYPTKTTEEAARAYMKLITEKEST